MTKSLQCVSTEVRKLPHYDGSANVHLFLDEVEREVPKGHHFQALELALHPTSTLWWGTHKDNFIGYKEYRRIMKLRFGCANTKIDEKYSGNDDPCDHLALWTRAWGMEPQS